MEPDRGHDVPPSASRHPATWKHGYPVYHAETVGQWRRWLEANCDTAPGVWLASWRSATGRASVDYDDVVCEALCVGWVDSTINALDDERTMQLVTPRKPRSTWSASNKERVARLEAEGRMTDRGRGPIEAAKANGWWSILDSVEALEEPDDLARALDAEPEARSQWDAFPPSARKAMLWWVKSAVRDTTRSGRIATIVAEAAAGRRAQG